MNKVKLNSIWMGYEGHTLYKAISVDPLTLQVVVTTSYTVGLEWSIVKDGGKYVVAPRKIEEYQLNEVRAEDLGLKLWLQL